MHLETDCANGLRSSTVSNQIPLPTVTLCKVNSVKLTRLISNGHCIGNRSRYLISAQVEVLKTASVLRCVFQTATTVQ
jgi:hypothetical protein